MHAIWLRATVAHNIGRKLAAWRFDCRHGITNRRLEALSPQLEVVDQRLHAVRDLRFRWRGDLAIRGGPRPWPKILQSLERLLTDFDALAHLGHAHQIAVVDIAVLSSWDGEIVGFVAAVRHILAQIPGQSGRTQHWPSHTIGNRRLGVDRADADR